jgi:hypothetical protein
MLTTLLCALILAVGLYAAIQQSENHARARLLADCQRLCEMIEAANAQAEARVLAHLPGEGAAPVGGRRPESARSKSAIRSARP